TQLLIIHIADLDSYRLEQRSGPLRSYAHTARYVFRLEFDLRCGTDCLDVASHGSNRLCKGSVEEYLHVCRTALHQPFLKLIGDDHSGSNFSTGKQLIHLSYALQVPPEIEVSRIGEFFGIVAAGLGVIVVDKRKGDFFHILAQAVAENQHEHHRQKESQNEKDPVPQDL